MESDQKSAQGALQGSQPQHGDSHHPASPRQGPWPGNKEQPAKTSPSFLKSPDHHRWGGEGWGSLELLPAGRGWAGQSFPVTPAPTDALEKPLDKKAGRNYGPPGSKRLVYFMDDLNMARVDAYGTAQPHTLLRQHLDYGHWYGTAGAALAPPGTSALGNGLEMNAELCPSCAGAGWRLWVRRALCTLGVPCPQQTFPALLSGEGGHALLLL